MEGYWLLFRDWFLWGGWRPCLIAGLVITFLSATAAAFVVLTRSFEDEQHRRAVNEEADRLLQEMLDRG